MIARRLALLLPVLALLAAPAPSAVQAQTQAQAQERLYAERVAIGALDQRCALFTTGERRALGAFEAQARGALLRSGTSDAAVARLASQARGGISRLRCTDPSVVSEARRVRSAHRAWASQLSAEYPGTARTWRASRAGADAWRAWQDLGQGVRAGFLRTASGVVFAVESPDTGLSGARLYLRDPVRIGAPRAGQRLTPPPRVGATAHVAALRRPAETRPRAGAAPRAGSLMVFSDATAAAVAAADPRDSFEIELQPRTGAPVTLIVEVGDIAAAWGFAAAE